MNQAPHTSEFPTELAAEKAASCPHLTPARVCAVQRGIFDLKGAPGV
ncbi:MAG: hypothetical protein ACI9U2_004101, partial [Bradymonadia bacterium]